MSNTQNETPCPVCGKTSYLWSKVIGRDLQYIPPEAFFWETMLRGGIIPARLCNNCGNIQLFAKDFVGEK